MAAVSPESTNNVSADDPSLKQANKGKNVDDGGAQRTEEGLNGDGGGRTSSSAVPSQNGEGAGGAGAGQNGSLGGLHVAASPEPASSPGDTSAQKNSGDVEKDKGSPSTTLIGTQKDTQARPKTNISPSEANGETTKSTASSPSKPKSFSTRSNSSFLSKLLRRFVPCIASTRAHAADTDETASSSTDLNSTMVHKEKQALKDVERPPKATTPAPAPSSSLSSPEPAPAPPTLTIPPTTTTPTTSDADVILPPTPTKRLLPQAETEGMTSGAVQPPGSTGDGAVHEHSRAHTLDSGDESEGTSYSEDDDVDEHLDDAEDEEDRLIMNGGAGIPIGPDGQPRPLLPPIAPHHVGRKCLVLDLDETLVHSSFKSIQQADYVVPVEIEYHWHNVYVIKRPGVDNFLKKMGEIYEVVVFTASLSKYADPVLDKLDIHQVVSHRLFRESCYNHKGNYVKDLSQLGRPIADTIILDNSPASYIFHPNNAVPVSSWFNDPHDTELTDLCPFLADLSTVDDVQGILDAGL